ncbi:MAG TPA: secretin N-terminal domain-containing protein [Candidatus Omnitrophota bacterium]|nr:secretin N-terminal domain-containing protein [Candidatus Omnitrophota bacterium]HPD85315.1 secretin N-terminal domain-containing protein [Candidatus Omnitrophota bacterium]HRZ04184.1 secretin N-terminal domain-containing protein [Candidatus Omnitrophota bacterium]
MKNPLSNLWRCAIIAMVLCLFWCSAYAGQLSENRFLYSEYSKTISMDFKDASLTDVLKIFSQQSGLNFIAAENVADKKITLFLDKVPVEEALERILDTNNLAYEIQPESNIFIVRPFVRPNQNLLTRVYPLKYATVSSSKLNRTFTIKEDSGSSSINSGDQASSPTSSSTENSGQTEKSGLVEVLKTILTESGKIVEDTRSNSIIVTDIPSQFPIIEETIARLDIPVPQILIEAEMLDISKNTGEQMGIKYGTTLVFSGAIREHYYPWNTNKVIHNPNNYDAPAPVYTPGTMDTSGLTATLQFLRSKTDTKDLARPRILTLNNETAEIRITTNEVIGLKTQIQSGGGSISEQSTEAERTITGVSLQVTPQANLLTRDITMAIVPKAILAKLGMIINGQQYKDPEERGTKSILRIHDGDTIMLGGLLRENDTATRTAIPVLGDIPIVGAAFRHKDNNEQERELIIFITPRILADVSTGSLALSGPQKLVREQEVPSARLSAIEKTLTNIEGRKQ